MYAHPLQNQKHPTYAIYSYDEEGLHELPFREDYEIKPENPDNLTIKRVIRVSQSEIAYKYCVSYHQTSEIFILVLCILTPNVSSASIPFQCCQNGIPSFLESFLEHSQRWWKWKHYQSIYDLIVLQREPGYEKDGAGYNWEAPSAVEYTPDENLDYEKVPKVAQRSARDEKYLGSPYQASQATQYEFHDSISPQQTVNKL